MAGRRRNGGVDLAFSVSGGLPRLAWYVLLLPPLAANLVRARAQNTSTSEPGAHTLPGVLAQQDLSKMAAFPACFLSGTWGLGAHSSGNVESPVFSCPVGSQEDPAGPEAAVYCSTACSSGHTAGASQITPGPWTMNSLLWVSLVHSGLGGEGREYGGNQWLRTPILAT